MGQQSRDRSLEGFKAPIALVMDLYTVAFYNFCFILSLIPSEKSTSFDNILLR